MITDQTQIDFFKKIAKSQFATMILDDYDSEDDLIFLTDSISNIYKYLNYNSFKNVTIYLSLDESNHLSNLSALSTTIYAIENLATLRGEKIILEVKGNGSIDFAIDFEIDINTVRQNGIIYTFENHNESEKIYGKNDFKKLIPVPGADSYFAIQTFKKLEEALDYYKSKIARYSDCEILKNVWFDENQIFFKKAPEHKLRDSLTQYLKISLRNTEARPEQVVDRSHPVDIKITWALVNRLALIEIKWLGKSLKTRKKQFTQIYTEARALSGASQLANYLDENIRQAPTYVSKGYLVIFDARRAKCNTNTIVLKNNDAMRYLNKEIVYNPQYHIVRSDFASPFRFFMEPKYIN
ncbi:hypothetical protein FY557_16030 [Chryseobacterium sp. SN22]|uniref:hypothetical protein n=1 Tax=Chryseobacterium sp. SN22 TaxID=2606431 RepID=UPI0011EEDF62|nr:hypothetical protein [Chryseobacterium sp. SN22]KAA0126684.1 hypothetical protein FY557_16030 [Chryseobacterium sp. SN22]